jgi:hypothetical protein
MKNIDLGFKYGMTYVNGGADEVFMNFGDSAVESDFFEFLITLAEQKEIGILKDYKEAAKEELTEQYNIEEITENMIVAKTYILQMIENRLWREYEEGVKKALEDNGYEPKGDYYFELKDQIKSYLKENTADCDFYSDAI